MKLRHVKQDGNMKAEEIFNFDSPTLSQILFITADTLSNAVTAVFQDNSAQSYNSRTKSWPNNAGNARYDGI